MEWPRWERLRFWNNFSMESILLVRYFYFFGGWGLYLLFQNLVCVGCERAVTEDCELL